MRYLITARGCDDSTRSIVELTDEQAEGIRLASVANNVRAESSGCKPTLSIKPESEANTFEIEDATEGASE
ncbi:hypothetical protein XU06_22795 [Rhodococcus erythropolis]|uniref:hypothetical protein n=1 Tax=Rhodococcus erythropolis TaxID=1833 RepID=UPI00061B66E3|nr:hypothetical protein [Rhodococcus erythropolis]AKD99190.1 hypothetical protein XU06_22795 [Rhodococcus erythropolis]